TIVVRTKSMIATLAGAGFMALCTGGSAHAWPWPSADLPWCITTDGGDYLDCSYFTQRQCLETARGVGYCQHNARYDWRYYDQRRLAPYTAIPPTRSHYHHRRDHH